MEGRFAELMESLAEQERVNYQEGRRWVRKAETLLDGILQCPMAWPHEVFIIQGGGFSDRAVVHTRDADGREYTFRRDEFGLFYEPQAKTRHERLREQLTR